MSLRRAITSRLPYRVKDALRPPWPETARRWVQGSFSQTGEDLLIAFIFEVLELAQPTFIDVGAFRPFHMNNTALLYLRGSRGINIDPDPDAIEAFRAERPEDTNLNIGCAAAPAQLTFHRMTSPSLNTFSRESAEEAVAESGGRIRVESTVNVAVKPIADVLGDLGMTHFPDLLSLDAEGMDVEILESMSGWPGRPTVICAETISYSESGRGERRPEIVELLTGHGYMQFADTYHNSIFVLEEAWRRS